MELLTVKEVAKLLRVSGRIVYQLVGEGRLGHHRVGNGRGSVRIRPKDVEDYLQSCRTNGRMI